ncbi:MAG TPA: hypothetical protein PK513_07150 [Alphaproteobacteria bacterium]|nr:hypothetical protein [Alphaproteobacteria bacterium]USO04730.1 MAG: hypothetical protein H6859_06055 [Rhodospirillales bacterium]HOO82262.1 hypothetical protein [Alphaproteobacteria bacterium]
MAKKRFELGDLTNEMRLSINGLPPAQHKFTKTLVKNVVLNVIDVFTSFDERNRFTGVVAFVPTYNTEEAKKSLREGDVISVRTFLPIEKLHCLSETDNTSLTLKEIEVNTWGDGVITCYDTTPKDFTPGTDENNERAMDAIRAMSQGHNYTDEDLNGPGSDSTPS